MSKACPSKQGSSLPDPPAPSRTDGVGTGEAGTARACPSKQDSSLPETARDIYLKAPRFIDHHPAEGRSNEEVLRSKIIIKKIINYGVNNHNGRKSIIDLEVTEHIEKSFIKILAGFAVENTNFILYRPKKPLQHKLVEHGFPKDNIESRELSLARA